MQHAVGHFIAPVHRQGLEQGVYPRPSVDGHEHALAVFTAVEHVQAEKIEIHHVDVWVELPQFVPHDVQIAVPAPADEHEILTVQVLHRQRTLLRQRVVNGHGAMSIF